MFELLSRYRRLFGIGLLLLLPFGIYYAHATGSRRAGPLGRAVLTVTAPLEAAFTGLFAGLGQGFHRYFALVGVAEDNEALRRELAELRHERDQLIEAGLENERLRRLLGYQDVSQRYRLLPAQVIGAGTSPYFRVVRIDKGQRDGARPTTPVVTAGGVVGRVLEVFGGYSEVLLLIDPNSSVDVLVRRTRARGVLKGTTDERSVACSIDYLRRVDEANEGDVVVTSGMGGVFPKGLVVGTVTEVTRQPFGLYQTATVQPTADFARLEEVLLLIEHTDPPQEPASSTPSAGTGE